MSATYIVEMAGDRRLDERAIAMTGTYGAPSRRAPSPADLAAARNAVLEAYERCLADALRADVFSD